MADWPHLAAVQEVLDAIEDAWRRLTAGEDDVDLHHVRTLLVDLSVLATMGPLQVLVDGLREAVEHLEAGRLASAQTAVQLAVVRATRAATGTRSERPAGVRWRTLPARAASAKGVTMSTATIHRLDLGAYDGPRAAALSGVPARTVYYWNTIGLVPATVPGKQLLWSYGDLLTLRLVNWLRQTKEEHEIPRTRLDDVREALEQLGDALWDLDEHGRDVPTIRVNVDGRIVRTDGGQPRTMDGQHVLSIDLFAPGDAIDLRRPRPRLRIVPGRVAGEPHLVGSRLSSLDVAGLRDRGLTMSTIQRLYPDEDPRALQEAVDLEDELAAA